jgi:hypothetical protein
MKMRSLAMKMELKLLDFIDIDSVKLVWFGDLLLHLIVENAKTVVLNLISKYYNFITLYSHCGVISNCVGERNLRLFTILGIVVGSFGNYSYLSLILL